MDVTANPSRSTSISFDAGTADGVRRLEDLGVTDVIVGVPHNPYDETRTA